jgi:hypothetical protein
MSKPAMIDDKAIAVVDGEWRSAREIYAILDEGAFVTTQRPSFGSRTLAGSNDATIRTAT